MKKTMTFLSLILSLGSWHAQAADLKNIDGFKLITEERLEEFESDVRIYEHLKTGARLIYLSNNDDEKVFSITFKTHPTDNTGIPHIIEHSVLCGSKKFPLKDPFVQLMKSSLKTFLNAMTFSDRTIYPVASRNDKDFMNLMHTYLDAVFYPKLLENDQILKQEGWHYEYDATNKKLEHSGVVYGEMKGAYSNPERLIGRGVLAALYPNTVYSYDSGGDPENIPDLTQENFVKFHQKHYHPSNAIIYFYGNGDIKKHLQFIDKEYLSHYDKRSDMIQVGQKPVIENVTLERDYASNESEKDASLFSIAFALKSERDSKKLLAMDILSYYLGQSDAAPLKQLILDKKFAKDASVDAERSIAWPYFEVSARNADGTRQKEFFKFVRETLLQYAQNGLDHNLLEAALKRKEFAYREFASGQPIGLTINYYINQDWLYGYDPIGALKFDKLFSELSSDIKKNYFENLLKELIENNSHTVQMVLKPNKDLAKKEEEAYREKMDRKLKGLNEKSLNEIIKSTEDLKKAQKTPDSPEVVKTLPTLGIKDLNKKVEIFPRKVEKHESTTLLTHELPTKGITYLNLYFKLNTVPQELIPYLPLFNHLMGSLDTEKYNYTELSKQIDLRSGGIYFDLFSEPKFNDANNFDPRLIVSLKAFKPNFEESLNLMNEILFNTKWDNKKRVIELVQKAKSSWDSSLGSDGMNFAMTRLQSHFSKAGSYQELTVGVSQYLFLKDLEKNIDKNYEDFISKMKILQTMIFNKNDLVISLAVDKKSIKAMKKIHSKFIEKLPYANTPAAVYKFTQPKGPEAIIVPGKVQYVVKAGKIDHYSGELQVINQNLRTDYLWNRVRVQNGAYGSFARFASTGIFQLFSYRDPNLEKTLEVFNEMPDYVSNLKMNQGDVEKIVIGTISNFDRPLRPKEKAKTSAELYLVGKTNEFRQQERNAIIGATNAKLQAWGPKFKKGIEGKDFVVSGSKSRIEESKKLFTNIIDLTN